MWLAGPTSDEMDEWAAELETGVAGWQGTVSPEPPRPPTPSPDDSAYEDVEERLGAVAAEEGWDESEVEAVRAYLSRVSPPASSANPTERDAPPPTVLDSEPTPMAPSAAHRPERSLPGGDELAAAMADLERREEPRPATGGFAAPPDAGPQPDQAHDRYDLGPAPGEPEWLRGRQDAAARAYRRLRRIFPNPEQR